jgi:hypothetical protein
VIDELASIDTNIPVSYVVRVNPTDLALLEPVKKPLMSELRQAITNHARFENYALSGEPLVMIIGAEDVPAGDCTIEPTGAQTTSATTPVEAATTWYLVGETGQRFDVVGDRVTIGRQGTCSVHIPDTNVSRVHAEMRRTADGWTIEDRGSTNGTKVNGEQIAKSTAVQPNDTLSFGSVTLTFVRG